MCIYIYIYALFTLYIFHYFFDYNIEIYIGSESESNGSTSFQVELFSPRSARNVPGILPVDAEHWTSGWNLPREVGTDS